MLMSLLVGLSLLAAPQDTVVIELPEFPKVELTQEVRDRLLDDYRAWLKTPVLSGVCLYGKVASSHFGKILHADGILEVNALNCPFHLDYDKELIGFLQFIDLVSWNVTKAQLMEAACGQLDHISLYYRVVGYVYGIQLFPGPDGLQPFEVAVGCVRTQAETP